MKTKIHKLKVYWMILCLIATTSLSLLGQKGIVEGLVESQEDGILMYANITVNSPEGVFITGGTTDIGGKYHFELDSGNYEIHFSYSGFAPRKEKIEIENGKTISLNILMEVASILDDVVVSSNKAGTSIAKTTVSLDLVRPDLVDNTNATKVDDVVNKVPGVTVVDGQANIRGGSGYSYGAGSRVLILVDDLPFMQADAGLPNWRDIPVENIDQIEVLKGAASALYGSSALNGIINIRTAYAKKDPLTKISLFGTGYILPNRSEIAWWNDDTVDGRIDGRDTTISPRLLAGPIGYQKPVEMGLQFAHRQKFKKFDWTLGGNFFYKSNYLAGSYERKFRINSNMRYRITDRFNVGVNFNVNTGNSAAFFVWGNAHSFLAIEDTSNYAALAGTITPTKLNRFAIDPFLTLFDKKEGKHRIQTRLLYVHNDNGNNQSNKSILSYGEYQYQQKISQWGDLQLVAGLVGQYTFVDAELYGNAEYGLSNFAGYVQADKGFIKKQDAEGYRLTVSVGARFEYNTIISPDSVVIKGDGTRIENPEPKSQEGKPVFRVGLNYELADYTFLRASWGQGYRYPTIAERYVVTNVDILEIRSNPTLRSETGWSAEIGLKQGLQITPKWKGFVDVSGFWTEYNDMMEFTLNGSDLDNVIVGNLYFQSVNIGATRIVGTEGSIMGTGSIMGVKTNILAGYTYVDPRFKDFNETQQALSSDSTNILKYRSQHTVKFDLESFFIQNKFSVGLSLQYNSAMKAIDAVFEDFFPQTTVVEDIFGIGKYRELHNKSEAVNLGLRVGYRHPFKDPSGVEKAAVKLSLVGKNLLNQEYTIRPGLMAAPANFTARIDIQF